MDRRTKFLTAGSSKKSKHPEQQVSEAQPYDTHPKYRTSEVGSK